MKCNEGKTERTIRIIAGVAIIGLGWMYQSWWGLIGLVLLITGMVGFCPIYAIFGLSTCEKK